MNWNILKDSKPSCKEKCVVAYVNQGNVMAGIFTYQSTASSSYWTNESGLVVYCRDNQQWYYVKDIIKNVEQRLEDELREELHGSKIL